MARERIKQEENFWFHNDVWYVHVDYKKQIHVLLKLVFKRWLAFYLYILTLLASCSSKVGWTVAEALETFTAILTYNAFTVII